MSIYLLWCLPASRGHQHTTIPELEPLGEKGESCSTFKREKSRAKTRRWHYPSICFHRYHLKLKPKQLANIWNRGRWESKWKQPLWFATQNKPWRTHGFMSPPGHLPNSNVHQETYEKAHPNVHYGLWAQTRNSPNTHKPCNEPSKFWCHHPIKDYVSTERLTWNLPS